MARGLGGISPGKLADIVVIDDLKSFKPKKVFVGGRLVVSNGSIVAPVKKKRPIPSWIKKTVKLRKFSEKDFEVKNKPKKRSSNNTKKDEASTVTANTIFLATEIITKLGSADLPIKDDNVLPSFDKDIWKVSAFDRTFGTSKHSIGFLENFGADIGAFASTWSFHENDLIVIGSNESDMAKAANDLVRSQGGLCVVKNGKNLAQLSLPVSGIISDKSYEEVSSDFESVTNTLVDSGCKFARPHLIPLFLSFLALPSVRILYAGIVDVKRRSFVSPLA